MTTTKLIARISALKKFLELKIDYLIFFVFGLAVFQSQYEVIRRLQLGYGLTDEAFSLNMAFARSDLADAAWVWPFSIPLSWLSGLSGGSVFAFRIIGYLVTLATVALLALVLAHLRGNQDFGHTRYSAAIVVLCALTIQSTFAYLLATPTYQWTIQIGLLLFLAGLTADLWMGSGWKYSWAYLAISLGLFLTLLSRPTGGILLSGGFVVVEVLKFGSRAWVRVAKVMSLVFMYVSVTNIVYPGLIRDFTLSFKWAKTLNPVGYSIGSEVLDVTKTYAFVFLLFLCGFAATNFLRKQAINEALAVALAFSIVLPLTFIAATLGFFIYSGVFSASLGILSSILYKRLTLISFAIGALPILVQFGSAMDTIITVPDNILSASLLMIYSPIRNKPETDKQETNKPKLMPRSLVSVSMLLVVAIVHSEQGYSFEKAVGSQASSVDPVTNLLYEPSKVRAIKDWRLGALGWVKPGDFVADLSYWHPGLISYLSAWPLEQSPGDKAYARTYKMQTRNYFIDSSPSHRTSTKLFMVAAAKNKFRPGSVCQPLSNFVSNKSIRESLPHAFAHRAMTVISVYDSQKVDGTLYPQNAYLLRPCP